VEGKIWVAKKLSGHYYYIRLAGLYGFICLRGLGD
jgi:hypothetical protein